MKNMKKVCRMALTFALILLLGIPAAWRQSARKDGADGSVSTMRRYWASSTAIRCGTGFPISWEASGFKTISLPWPTERYMSRIRAIR